MNIDFCPSGRYRLYYSLALSVRTESYRDAEVRRTAALRGGIALACNVVVRLIGCVLPWEAGPGGDWFQAP